MMEITEGEAAVALKIFGAITEVSTIKLTQYENDLRRSSDVTAIEREKAILAYRKELGAWERAVFSELWSEFLRRGSTLQ